MPVDPAIVRRFAERAAALRVSALAASPAPPSAERALGFTFTPGDRAIDLVTGHEVLIHAGHEVTDLVQSPRTTVD